MEKCRAGEEYNEILRKCESQGKSKTEIYYWQDPKTTPSGKDWFDSTEFEGITPEHRFPKIDDVKRDYILLGKIPMKDLDAIYMFMQGEFWSPRGEARELIRKKGLDHTSMSIGDVIRLPNGKWMAVDEVGFRELE